MFAPNSNPNSLDQLKQDASQIVERLQSDPHFCRNAAANPVEALRRLGFQLDSPAIRKIEERLPKTKFASA